MRCRGAGEEDGSVLVFEKGREALGPATRESPRINFILFSTYLIRSSLQFPSSERTVFPLILNSVRDDGKSSQLNYEICTTALLCLLCSHVSARRR